MLNPVDDPAVVELRLVLGEMLQDLVARQPRDALDGRQRQRERLVADVDDQRVRDRERVRQPDQEARALAAACLDAHRAAELLDLVVDDVHADATAGRLRELAGRAETRLQDQLDGLLVGDPLVLGEQALLVGLAADGREIEAAAVVAHLDDDFRAFAADLQQHLPGLGLAALRASGRFLDAVRNRVAQQVLERRQHRLEHLPVDLVVLAVDDQLGLLAGVGAGLAHDALQARQVPLERHHARLHEAALQVGRDPGLLRQQRVGLVRETVQELVDARDVVGGFRKRAR